MEGHPLGNRFTTEVKRLNARFSAISRGIAMCDPRYQSAIDLAKQNLRLMAQILPTLSDMKRLKQAVDSTIGHQATIHRIQTAFTRSEWMTDLSLPVDWGAFKATVPTEFKPSPAILSRFYTAPLSHEVTRLQDAFNHQVSALVTVGRTPSPLQRVITDLQRTAEWSISCVAAQTQAQEFHRTLRSIEWILPHVQDAQRYAQEIIQAPQQWRKRIIESQVNEDLNNDGQIEPIAFRDQINPYQVYESSEERDEFYADFPLLRAKAQQYSLEPSHLTDAEQQERKRLLQILAEMCFLPGAGHLVLSGLYLLALCRDEGAFLELASKDTGFWSTTVFQQKLSTWKSGVSSGSVHAKERLKTFSQIPYQWSSVKLGRPTGDNRTRQRFLDFLESGVERSHNLIYREMAKEELKERNETLSLSSIRTKAEAIKKRIQRDPYVRWVLDRELPWPFKYLELEERKNPKK